MQHYVLMNIFFFFISSLLILKLVRFSIIGFAENWCFHPPLRKSTLRVAFLLDKDKVQRSVQWCSRQGALRGAWPLQWTVMAGAAIDRLPK